MKPVPFTVDIPQPVIDDLHARLKATRFPEIDDASSWAHGTSLEYMKELVDYWQHSYDWRKAEKEINSFANYKVTIDDTEIHFIHEKSKKPGAKAVILNHGWPDSFYRFHKVVPMLAEEYDVIVPSLPGYGFSARKAMNSKQMAALFRKLMTEVLGYESFLAVGGDKGTGVALDLARQHSDVVEAIHLTDTGWAQPKDDPSTFTDEEKAFAESSGKWFMSDGAYISIQSTKPQSLSFALNDSPAGLAAWAASFAASSRGPGKVDEAFGGRDDFLTLLTIYWVTGTIGSAMQMYQEDAMAMWGGGGQDEPKATKSVPVAFAVYPHELPFPQEWVERLGLNVQRFRNMPQGGHFAPMEVPELYASDIKEAFDAIAK